MPKLFCLITMQGGSPAINTTDPSGAGYTPVKGWVLCDQVGAHGAYLVSGTAAQLTALNALSNVTGIVVVTEGGTKWAELDGVIALAVRTRLNTWLAARGFATIPAGWTYRQVVNAVFKRLNNRFDLDHFDVAD